MSYDLSFRPCESTHSVPIAAFYSYFERRPHYHVDKECEEADYTNEDTGAYFSFLYAASDDGKLDLKKDPEASTFSFRRAYNGDTRSDSATVKEAAVEIKAVCDHFSLCYNDAQRTAQHDVFTPFSPRDFMESWQESFGWAEGVKKKLVDQGETLIQPSPPKSDLWSWLRSLWSK